MGTKRTISTDDLYRTLKVRDEEILKHFNDESIDDQTYLFYAINSDIISNALSVVIAYESNNIDSIGVDNCCRTIIEAFLVMKMRAVGDISDEQAKIFRYHYAIVDISNMKKFVDEYSKQSDDFKYVDRDRERAYEAIMSFHKCAKKDLKNDPDLDDSNFYLKKKLGEKIKYSELIRKYQLFDVNTTQMYEFFSIFVHPRFEIDSEIEKMLRKIRFSYIQKVLDYVVEYLKECKLFVLDNSLKTFKQDFYERSELKNNVGNINDIHRVFEILEKKVCILPDGTDNFTCFFLRTMDSIITDMMVSMSLGYREHIISLFKSVFEYIAVYFCVNEFEYDVFKDIKMAYCYSSRIQINNLVEKMKLPSMFGEETISGLKEIFEKYYKKEYGIDNYEKFLDNVTHNARYFLNKDNSSFNSIVNKLLNDLFDDPIEREYTKLIYRVSKDMNHGGGYAFNSSPGLVDSMCRHAQNAIYKFITKNISAAEHTLKEHGINVDLSLEYLVFQLLSKNEEEEIEKTNKAYLTGKKPA